MISRLTDEVFCAILTLLVVSLTLTFSSSTAKAVPATPVGKAREEQAPPLPKTNKKGFPLLKVFEGVIGETFFQKVSPKERNEKNEGNGNKRAGNGIAWKTGDKRKRCGRILQRKIRLTKCSENKSQKHETKPAEVQTTQKSPHRVTDFGRMDI